MSERTLYGSELAEEIMMDVVDKVRDLNLLGKSVQFTTILV